MYNVEVHVRYTTSDFDYGGGPGGLFDYDALEGAPKATVAVIEFLSYLANDEKFRGKYRAFNKDSVLDMVKPAMKRISRAYWRDFDYDERKKIAQVREEVARLTKMLNNAVLALDQRPPYVRDALNSEVHNLFYPHSDRSDDVFRNALQANSDLLAACKKLIARDREKPGEAIRFRNAIDSLAQLWEEMLGQDFPKTTKHSLGRFEAMTGVRAAFDSPAAQYAYIAISQIGRGWVKPSQLEAAIKARPKRKSGPRRQGEISS